MSDERDELCDAIIYHPWLPDHEGLYTGLCPSCPDLKIQGGHNSPSHAYHLADAILAAGYRKPRTITTEEELDALPYGTAVGHDEGWGATIAQRQPEDMRWYPTGCLEYIRPEALLPAVVLWEPTP